MDGAALSGPMPAEKKPRSPPPSWWSIALDLVGRVQTLLRTYADRARLAALWFRRGGTMAAGKNPCLQPPALSWSSIPLELAGLVLRLLPAYADRARFAAVCRQWRAAAREQQMLPPPLPLLALPDGTFYSLPYPKPFRFPGCGFAGYQSACGSWLVFPRDDGCFLVDPFSRETVMLPALSSIRLRPPNAVAKWSYEHGAKLADPYVTWMHMKDSDKLHISKLVLCSPNLVAALVGIGYTSQILMCQPGALSWSVCANDQCKRFEDMSFYQGKLYALTKDENLLVVNISQDHTTGDPQVSQIGQVIKGDPWYSILFTNNAMLCKKLYLVESCGAMLMVRRTIVCKVPEPGLYDEAVARRSVFEVFEADFEHSRWVSVSIVGANLCAACPCLRMGSWVISSRSWMMMRKIVWSMAMTRRTLLLAPMTLDLAGSVLFTQRFHGSVAMKCVWQHGSFLMTEALSFLCKLLPGSDRDIDVIVQWLFSKLLTCYLSDRVMQYGSHWLVWCSVNPSMQAMKCITGSSMVISLSEP